MSLELKEEVLKTVLDCDGDLNRMDVSEIINIVMSMQTQSLFTTGNGTDNFDDMMQFINECKKPERN